METYASILLWVLPVFMVMMTFEMLYGHFTNKQTYSFMDTLSSLSSGITNVLKDSLGLVVVILSYPYILDSIAFFDLESSVLLYVVAFFCIDFASYWNHRLNHKVNIFWNRHVIHHSSEEFNLACALRQSISAWIGFGALFLIPAAFFGVPPEIIAFLAPLHLFSQFWYHTQHIGKLGFLEYIIVTPSQHRVHHAINPIQVRVSIESIFLQKNIPNQIVIIVDGSIGIELSEYLLHLSLKYNQIVIFYLKKRDHFWRYLRNRFIYYIVCLIVIIIFF